MKYLEHNNKDISLFINKRIKDYDKKFKQGIKELEDLQEKEKTCKEGIP